MAMRSLSKSPHCALGLRKEMQSLRHALRPICQMFSAHTHEAVSNGQACGTAILRVSPAFWVANLARYSGNQGHSWNSHEGALSMFALDEDGYNTSMAGRAPGIYCGCCGTWTVSTMSRGAGVESPCVIEPYESMASSWARYANAGYGRYIYPGREALLAAFPHKDAQARAREQLAQQ